MIVVVKNQFGVHDFWYPLNEIRSNMADNIHALNING